MSSTDLSQFLVGRRARLEPAEVGLPAHGRRRTAGLRREEVAALAGVSVDYYTRLEQGRDSRPSAAVVRALADALRLDDAGRAHLHHLAGLATTRTKAPLAVARPHAEALLQALQPVPACLLDPAMDVLATNDAMRRLLGDPRRWSGGTNFARAAFLEPSLRSRFTDWPDVVHDVVATLRASAARHPASARLVEVVGELTLNSVEFAQAWGRFEVVDACSGVKRLQHPQVGALTVHYESLALEGDGQRIVTYLPVDEHSAERLALLTRGTPSRAPDEDLPAVRLHSVS